VVDGQPVAAKLFKSSSNGLDPVESACREAEMLMLDAQSEVFPRLRAYYCGDERLGVPPVLLSDMQSGMTLGRAFR